MEHSYQKILQQRSEVHPHRIALIFEGKKITYRHLHDSANNVAAWLLNAKINKGDRVAFLDYNNDDYIHLLNGCLIIGVIPVSINWRSTRAEINYILQNAGCRLFFYGHNFTKTAETVNAIAAIKSFEIPGIIKHINQQKYEAQELPEINQDEPAILIYTSGTTGNPKGVLLSNKNIYAMYLSLRNETPLFGPASVNLIAGPWYSVVGVGYFIFGIYTGCTNVTLKYFDPIEICRLIQQYKITNAFFAPVMMKVICALDEINDFDLSSLQNIQYGGSPIDETQLRICYNTFKCNFTQGYGLTETSGIATVLRFDDHKKTLSGNDDAPLHILHSAGKPYAGIEIKIVDENLNTVSPGNTGEVCLKGDVVALGYWNSAGEGDKLFNKDGWLLTGDIGYLDQEGYLFLIDRKHDLIISKAINIFPTEIETILNGHPQIKECAIIGIPHDIYGETICAVVVIENGEIQLNELRSWAKDKMAEYKLPTELKLVTELPRNPAGKILRKQLRELFWERHTRRIN
ncbi:MAG: class I adenylate-forming enzyme family protein [Chitinophagales bacterium]